METANVHWAYLGFLQNNYPSRKSAALSTGLWSWKYNWRIGVLSCGIKIQGTVDGGPLLPSAPNVQMTVVHPRFASPFGSKGNSLWMVPYMDGKCMLISRYLTNELLCDIVWWSIRGGNFVSYLWRTPLCFFSARVVLRGLQSHGSCSTHVLFFWNQCQFDTPVWKSEPSETVNRLQVSGRLTVPTWPS